MDGISDGLLDGARLTLGTSLGVSDGERLGMSEGEADGDLLGTSLGEVEGDEDGV